MVSVDIMSGPVARACAMHPARTHPHRTTRPSTAAHPNPHPRSKSARCSAWHRPSSLPGDGAASQAHLASPPAHKTIFNHQQQQQGAAEQDPLTHHHHNAQGEQDAESRLRGTCTSGAAVQAPGEKVVIPLTALHPCQPASWPSAAARRSLYNNCPAERVEAMHLSVQGRLPSWLRGSFYRNGPGKFQGTHAVFDGCAMVVRFAVDSASQSVAVSHRFLDTTYYRACLADGGEHKFKMAHDPAAPRSALGRLHYMATLGAGTLKHGVHIGDNALVSIFPQGRQLVAHTETLSGTYLVDPKSLETLGRVQYSGTSGGDEAVTGMIKTAHPFYHPNGDIINLAGDFTPVATYRSDLVRPPRLTLYRQPAGDLNRRTKLASLPYLKPTSPSWVHQVPVSQHYAVVVQNPCFYDIQKMLFGEGGEHMVFKWRPREGSLLHLVHLEGREPVKTFRAPPFLATHWINAFEESPHGRRLLHLDACVTPSPSLMAHWALSTVRSEVGGGKQIEPSYLRRLTLDLDAPDGTYLSQQPLLRPLVDDSATDYAMELPAINPHYACRRHRYVYAACAVRPSNCWNALTKVDVESGDCLVWHEAGAACWEPVFVPAPGSNNAEDEGVVLSTLMQADGRAALLVLDARTWQEVARAALPYGLPNGFHGCWVPLQEQEG